MWVLTHNLLPWGLNAGNDWNKKISSTDKHALCDWCLTRLRMSWTLIADVINNHSLYFLLANPIGLNLSLKAYKNKSVKVFIFMIIIIIFKINFWNGNNNNNKHDQVHSFSIFFKATQQSYITKQKLLNTLIMQSCVDGFEAVVAMLIL